MSSSPESLIVILENNEALMEHSRYYRLLVGAFLWDDPDRIVVDQMKQLILFQSRFISSFDLP